MTALDGQGPPHIAVLADDLTSAGDGAAPFLRSGHAARVLFAAPTEPVRTPGVTAIDLGTRLLDEPAAAARTREAARRCADVGLLFKTVDSTLRGHVPAEVLAARDGAGRSAVVIAPAFPAEGRVTVDGVQYVRGVPVHESEYARDPVHPVRCADLAALFPGAARVGPGPGETARLPGLVEEGGLIVCSARGDDDLDRLVAVVACPDDVLWVGSPGLAAALARRWPAVAGGAVDVPGAARRTLVAVGSVNPATRRQLAVLRARTGVRAVTVGGDTAASASVSDSPWAPAPVAASVRYASTAPVLVVQTPGARDTPAAARALGRSLAELVRTLTEQRLVDTLVLTGGETAATVLDALGITGIDLIDEPEPGVARGTPLGGPGLPALIKSVLIKAGGFGDDDLLLRLCDLVRRPPHAPCPFPGFPRLSPAFPGTPASPASPASPAPPIEETRA
ncbi:four-carbon acid sugar kinase family protein [Streptomyces sp. NPDC047123]|uniref:four-carbon acid sugar kinase family protein n=1 Tax=Streptomyces sp. NPDC047123 TaxID=3155622 RepID=UPI0033F832AE